MDFSAALEKRQQDLRAMQLLALALLVGCLLFLTVVVGMSQTQPGPAEPVESGAQLANMLLAVQVFMAPSCWGAALVLYKVRMKSVKVRPDADADGVLDSLIPTLRIAMILALALCEGPALFGIVTVFMAHLQGVLDQVPYVWGGLLSTAMMIAAVSAVVPTTRRVEAMAREAHQKAGRA